MKFITGNASKFKEMRAFLPNLEQMKLDIPEIQDLDPQKVIEAKVIEAQKILSDGQDFIVEDTSVSFWEMNNLPGTFIKFFVDDLGVEGIWNLAKNFDNKKATARSIIAYSDMDKNIYFFEGSITGQIVKPRGLGFGWNPIFQVDGSNKNFSEMNNQERIKYSMRSKAAVKLHKFLVKKYHR